MSSKFEHFRINDGQSLYDSNIKQYDLYAVEFSSKV